ncbi:RNA-directed DNA polymerase, eukaryota, reverse transcriptase zinc-binding domain protein, partial [Tanacetum coccineum]
AHNEAIEESPWVILGDFNVTLYADECSNGLIRDCGIQDFRRCIEVLGMEDLSMNDMFFTWIQKRNNPELGVLKKLDKIMGNSHFLDKLSDAYASFLPFVSSDHSPAMLTFPDVVGRKKRSFRFMNYLTKKNEFLKVVKEHWNSPVSGFAMYILAKRLKMKPYMRELNVKNAYKDAVIDEEKVLKQNSKIRWLKEGDHNRGYFYKVVKGRKSKGRIGDVNDECDQVFPVEDPSNLCTKKLFNSDAVKMVEIVTDEEIKVALFDIDDDKASGPYGFTSKFFKTSWKIIKNDVIGAVKEFFRNGRMLGEINTTLISLIPKSKAPIKVSDYRPISCCNVIYKCISNVMANRIKVVLNKLIDKNQSAFVDGRQISDNILLTQELMNGYNSKNKGRRCAFKFDIQKAYDTVNWYFLKFSLKNFGFHAKMIKWITECLSTTSFSGPVNGESHGFFKAKRGLRQGDPISPYHFTIVIKITQILFADDLLLLCHGDMKSTFVLRRALDESTLASGLYPSMEKSTVYFGNVSNDIRYEILMVMPFKERTFPVTYLGVPLVAKKLCIKDCKILIDNVKKRLDDWKNEFLTFASRLQLIASNVISDKESVWVKWVQVHWIKVQNIWNYTIKDSSWCWKQLLRLRDNIRRFVGVKLGDGKKCNIWFDRWHNNGPLCKLINHNVMFLLHIKRRCQSCNFIGDDGWKWHRDWNGRFMEVINVPVSALNSDIEDRPFWIDNKGKEKKLNVNEVWKGIRNNVPKVIWHKHVWFSQCIPSHSFILLVAIKGRLKTQNIISKWLKIQDIKCVFCKGEFISIITNRYANNCIWSVIQRLVFGASLYFIWQERNARLFRNTEWSEDVLFKQVVDTVRLKLMSLKIRKSIQKRNNPELGVLKKLDRIMGNSHFLDKLSDAYASFLPCVSSDHSPAMLTFPDVVGRKKRSFRFMNYLTEKNEFLKVVEEHWNSPVSGFAMYILAKRLKMKPYMRELNVKNAYKDAVIDEEKVLKQKSKIRWLKEGDHNRGYFHKVVKGRKSKSRIGDVNDECGNSFKDNEVAGQFVKHFQNFLGTEDQVFPVEDPSNLFTKKLFNSDAVKMVEIVTDEEIKVALFDIDDDKASGPYGFTSKFFKTSWKIIKNDVIGAVKEFFRNGRMLGEINTTLISLIPKSKAPIKVSDYRPIACCNVIYKCISKVMANRIKVVLNKLIDKNQSAFVAGRQISDNILLTQELMNGYNSKNKGRRCAFKFDIQKAYDTVNWYFLKFSLENFGFHAKMIKWIMECLSTTSFSGSVNGESHGFFKAKRGLRQGDPISPYLFTIVIEVFSLMVVRQIQKEKRFKYHWGCKELKITHILFADDLLLLCHGDMKSASVLRRALDESTLASGLYPSMEKSTVYFGNVSNDIRYEILMVMPFKERTFPVTYLGVPLVAKKLCIKDCEILIDNVKKRLDDWKNEFLTFASRLQLIASVLCSLQLYWATIFVLPINICDSIKRLFKKFLWAAGKDYVGKASVSWDEVCRPKSQGGLGLKLLHMWNEALMAKHLWNVISDKESIWQLLRLRDNIRRFVGVKLGDGKKYAKVADFIGDDGWKWPRDWNGRFMEVINVPVSALNSDIEDRPFWIDNKGKEKKLSVNESFIHPLGCNKRKAEDSEYSFQVVEDPRHEMCLLDSKLDFVSNVWGEVISSITNRSANNSIWSVIQRLVFGASVYFIWQERNARLFRNTEWSEDVLFKQVVDTVRLKLMSLKIRKSVNVKIPADMWNLVLCNGSGKNIGLRRKSRSRIGDVNDECGNSFKDNEGAGQFVKHFQNFLGTEDQVFPVEDPSNLFTKKLFNSDAIKMVEIVTDKEIKVGLFDIDDDKASGPYGFTSKNGRMLGEINTSLISLIPKSKAPIKVSDYRPIVCCNVIYKCISKVMADRIKVVLNKLIDKNQSAFVAGRQISDNIILTQELMNGYNISLENFGFHAKMIKWIMECLSTTSFSVSVNGESHGFFKAKRGLRQGDPISPYLFTIVIEVFSLMVDRQIQKEKHFKYHWGCKELKITHILFADDLLLLCHGDMKSAFVLRRALDESTLASGLYPSMEKSTVYFGNVSNDIRYEILMVMPFKERTFPVTYLGVPLVAKKLCIKDCEILIDNVKKSLDDWKNEFLTFASRLQLIASVLCSLQVYWATIFFLPINIFDSIKRLFKKFLWAAGKDYVGKAYCLLDELCIAPISQVRYEVPVIVDASILLVCRYVMVVFVVLCSYAGSSSAGMIFLQFQYLSTIASSFCLL